MWTALSQPPTPEPRLQPTNPATLIVAALGSAAVAWLIISTWYGSMPTLPWLPAFTLLALALVEFALAQQTRARIERKPGRPGVEPLAVARYAVLAKASSLAGAIFAGFSAGLTLWLLVDGQRLAAASRDLPAAITSLVCSLALVGAGLWLERACRVPKRPEDDKPDIQ
ncbi:DUF3180 domain-containing protein [Catellatospora citrea]|uniref:Membrane protein n=1 Tax=Catellatospora citrea TaxID=53366 RepID=A0A8J3KSA8_9ACTN|nr:DUF3180 domain-containing protein [Catellatospora citrea]RKE08642.1 uncharacterized protein DUF3180 [Catellatospora citrea]GIG02544.1 membrane protein [Catellatospora citrea]